MVALSLFRVVGQDISCFNGLYAALQQVDGVDLILCSIELNKQITIGQQAACNL